MSFSSLNQEKVSASFQDVRLHKLGKFDNTHTHMPELKIESI